MKIHFQTEANTIWLYIGNKIERSVSFWYCPHWEHGIYSINNNGAKKGVKEHTCYDFNIHFWKFKFSYTNWNYNRRLR